MAARQLDRLDTHHCLPWDGPGLSQRVYGSRPEGFGLVVGFSEAGVRFDHDAGSSPAPSEWRLLNRRQ